MPDPASLLTLTFLVHSLVAWHLPKAGGPALGMASGFVMVWVAGRLCYTYLVNPGEPPVLNGITVYAVFAILVWLGVNRLEVYVGDPVSR